MYMSVERAAGLLSDDWGNPILVISPQTDKDSFVLGSLCGVVKMDVEYSDSDIKNVKITQKDLFTALERNIDGNETNGKK